MDDVEHIPEARPGVSREPSPGSSTVGLFQFGACCLDLAARRLTVANRVVPLQPRSFALLRLFLEHPGKVLTKRELFAAIWPDEIVGDAALSVAIRKLRAAFETAPSAAGVRLSTVFGQGYRLDTPVERVSRANSSPRAALGVLPVVNDTDDPALDWVTEGLACLIHYKLSRLPDVILLPLTSTLSGGKLTPDSPQANEASRGQSVLRCRVSRAHGQFELAAQVALGSRVQWQAVFSGSEPADLVAELAHAIAIAEPDFEPKPDLARNLALSRVLALEMQGDIKTSLDALLHCLGDQQPDQEQAGILMRLLRFRGRWREARKVGRDAVSLGSGPHELRLRIELTLAETTDGDSEAIGRAGVELSRCLEQQAAVPAPLRALALSVLGVVEIHAGRNDVSLQLGERAVLIADKAGDVTAAIETRLRLAWASGLMGRSGPSLARLTEALALAERHSLGLLAANCWLRKSYGLSQSGRSQEALEAIQRCVQLAPGGGDLRLAVLARIQLISMLMRRGRIGEADAACHDLQMLADELGSEHQSSEVALIRAIVTWGQGSPINAIAHFEQLVIRKQLNQLSAWHRAFHLRYYAEHLLLLGRREDGARVIEELSESSNWLESLSMLTALQHLVSGDRTKTIEVLRGALRAASISYHGIRLRISLAWMLLEDADCAGAQALRDELEAIGVDWNESVLLGYAMNIVQAPHTLEAAQWALHVRRLPALYNNYPWMADVQTARDLVRGESRRLPAFLVLY